MNDTPKPGGDVLRRNPERECGTPIGQVAVKIHDIPNIQVISFYCNKPRLHTDDCAFVGKEVVVIRNRLIASQSHRA